MTIVEEFGRDPNRVLDRLVDGELGTQQRQRLLATFDDEPGAWRSCALAFLEAQSWRLQLSRVASEPILAEITAPRRAAAAERRTPWALWVAVAASVLVAFALGTRFPFARPANDVAPASVAAAPHGKVPPRQDTHAEVPANHAALATNDAPSDEPAVPETLTLTPLGGDGGQAIELPIVESDAVSAVAASEEPSTFSNAFIQQFEQDGFEVNRQQQLWPVELPDGRRVLLPIEEVDIRAPEVERL